MYAKSLISSNTLADKAEMELVAVVDMPTAYSDHPLRAHSFINRQTGVVHLALVSQGHPTGVPIVRVHSECLTGDALGSLRCDCGPQLQESLARISQEPGSAVIYLRGQEGRGIGLANKMRAYALQDGGLDTVDANRALGLPDDARRYDDAAAILRALQMTRIRLLTNNPEKSAALAALGLTIETVEPLVIPANAFNQNYLATKAEKFGHALPRDQGTA